MSRNRIIALTVAGVIVAGLAALLLARRGDDQADSQDVKPTASVTIAPVRSEALQDHATVYGVVQADPAGTSTVAAPRPVIVTRILVWAGETVAAGQPLIEVANAPEADVAYRQAADAVTFAQADLARVQRLYDARLAASDQLEAAKKALADAQAAIAAQQTEGGGLAHQSMSARAASVVTNIAAAPGDHVAQGAPLLVLARQDDLSVKLGVEPSIGRVLPGQAVTIRPTAGGPPIASRLTMVGRAADPTTRTIDAIAPLRGVSVAPPIGSAVEADIVTGTHMGLAAPRAAVVYDETGAHLFVVSGGVARRVFVTVGGDFGDQVEVSGAVSAGQFVAVQGAYELQDGMAVKVAGR